MPFFVPQALEIIEIRDCRLDVRTLIPRRAADTVTARAGPER